MLRHVCGGLVAQVVDLFLKHVQPLLQLCAAQHPAQIKHDRICLEITRTWS